MTGLKPADAIDLLQAHVDTLWQRTARPGLSRIERGPRGDGSLYVEFRDNAYEITCEERGVEYSRERGLSLDNAAFILIFGQAASICGREEAGSSRADDGTELHGYSRWNWMYPTIRTMTAICADFGDRSRAHYRSTLQRAPLDEEETANNRFPFLTASDSDC